MKKREIAKNVYCLGARDWDRRLFDALIPLPDGTSYNCYLIKGSEKTALLDTVDPSKKSILMEQLQDVDNIDYIISHHTEQDHSGMIPEVLDKYKQAKVIASSKAKAMLMDHLLISADRITTVEDGEVISLGDKSLKFIYTPWVHWPETMVSYLEEDNLLFSCDFFGSHLATTDLYAHDEPRVYEAAKRYYAEIMMPFRGVIQKNIEKISSLKIDYIAPSHGPIYDKPKFIIDAYRDWTSDKVKNIAIVAYVSMHGSTRKMAEHLVDALGEKGITVYQFDLTQTDLGKLAISLVDAATIVIGAPTVYVGAHPSAIYAAYLANSLRPKLKFAAIIGSYGWAHKLPERIAEVIPNLKVEMLGTVIAKGHPKEEDFKALDALAENIAKKHKTI